MADLFLILWLRFDFAILLPLVSLSRMIGVLTTTSSLFTIEPHHGGTATNLYVPLLRYVVDLGSGIALSVPTG